MISSLTTVEIDSEVATQAASSLSVAGYAPRVIAGDGIAGYSVGALYDRIHVTCGIASIPLAWITQTSPGGLIVAPWSPTGGTGYKVRLTVIGELTAVGSFHGSATYMMMRAQRMPSSWMPHHSRDADKKTTQLDPRFIADGGEGAHLAVIARVPGVGWHTVRDDNGATSVLLFEANKPSGAWAACDHEPGCHEFAVTQYGDRQLWDEAEAACLSWLRSGAPGAERYGITVDPVGARIWLDNPRNVIGPPTDHT